MSMGARVVGSRCRGKGLRGGTENLFEFATKMGFAGEFQFGGGGFVGIPLSDELFSQSALQLAKPTAGSAMQVLTEQTLQLALGDRTQRSRLDGVKVRLSGHLFPFFNCQKTAAHMCYSCNVENNQGCPRHAQQTKIIV